jgi:hypothetical protein
MGKFSGGVVGAVVLSAGVLLAPAAQAADSYLLTDRAYAAYNAINQSFAGMAQWHDLQCQNEQNGEAFWRAEEARLAHVRAARGNVAANGDMRLHAAVNVLSHQLESQPALLQVIQYQGLSAREYAEFSFTYLLAANSLDSVDGTSRNCDVQQWASHTGYQNCRFSVRHAGEAYLTPTALSAHSCPAVSDR